MRRGIPVQASGIMRPLRNHGVFWIGMPLATAVTAFLCYFGWQTLINREAVYYGQLLTQRLQSVVRRLDALSERTFTPAVYARLHRQRLQDLQLGDDPLIAQLVPALDEIVPNPYGILGLFTNCPSPRPLECYFDYFFDRSLPYTSQRPGPSYNPRSRPWYLVSKLHTDWVLLSFMMMVQEVPTYPRTTGLGFVKRMVWGPTDKAAGTSVTEGDEDGLWFVVASPNATQAVTRNGITTMPFLDMLFPQAPPRFTTFGVNFADIQFTAAALHDEHLRSPDCRGVTDFSGFHYNASVQCFLDGQPIHYVFKKRFDAAGQLWLLLGLSVLLLLFLYRFFCYVSRLQSENLATAAELDRGRLANAFGAKLVHDLKKGILGHLSILYEGREAEFPQQVRYIRLLNKYVSLLGNNLRGERETHWVRFTREHCLENIALILGSDITSTPGDATPFVDLTLDDVIQCRLGSTWPTFVVPEISCFRIFKNIIENYHTHGVAPLHVTMAVAGGQIQVRATNPVAGDTTARTSGFGLAIIRQLVADNFGPAAEVHEQIQQGQYCLEIRFPIWSAIP